MIELPYPPKELNPNKRLHWADKNKHKKAYFNSCYLLALGKQEGMKFSIEFCPPCNRKRDRDNIIASFKAGQDALAKAWGVDDANFEIIYKPIGKPVKDGCVKINFI
ncbi:MAG: hypothetical protein CBC71_06175 [Rhodobacteraceae bacterium TMED111]|nr:endodeoxyribonuclease RusA [Marinovum sp.]OUV41086.1 MAG: hypothetical protein CBC71_06175 [Rhodobacteraceae bacterium TMED111]|tara:strand:- start:24573 stop:24893 length:321 start_codon:yes stop_codon:yes gene_type:complete